MLIVKYQSEQCSGEKNFPSTVKGEREALKFCTELRDKRLNHPWFYKLKEVEKLELKFKACSNKSKKKLQLEIDLKYAEQDRKETLEILGIDAPPKMLTVEIFRK
jgi:hypothetical protein